MASGSSPGMEKHGLGESSKGAEVSCRKDSLLKTSITDQWQDFPQFVLPKNVQTSTPASEDSKECKCPGPAHLKNCHSFRHDNPSKPIAPAQYWKTVEETFKARGPKPKAPEKVENRYSLEAVRARALANGDITDEEDFYDDYSDYREEFGVTPESDLSHMDPFIAGMLRDMWRHDGRLPKPPTKCSICSEGHHHKKCPYYEAFGKRTKNRYQTAVEFYQYAKSRESSRHDPQPPQ